MKLNLKKINVTLDEFIKKAPVPARYNLQHNFDLCSELAKEIIHHDQSLDVKNVFELISLEQDGSYPLKPNVDAARIGVHIIWYLSQTTKPLFELIQLKTSPWYVKVEALKCLRLANNKIHWPSVIKVIKNNNLENEIKIAALNTIVFHDAVELISDLEKIQRKTATSDYFGSRLFEHIVFTRAKLGDPKIIIQLLEYCNHQSSQNAANKALSELIQKNGGEKHIASQVLKQSNIGYDDEENIWLALQNHDNQAVIVWALSNASVSEGQTQKSLNLLSHSEWTVRNSASKWLATNKVNKDVLLAHIANRDQVNVSRSWAAYTLLEIDQKFEQLLKPYLKDQCVFFKSWPFEAPESVRLAIVKEYARYSGDGTDIRYMLENKLNAHSEHSSNTTSTQDRQKLVKALEANGIKVSKQQDASEFNGQGGGNYWVLILEPIEENVKTTLAVSDLGKFVARDVIWFQSDNSYDMIDELLGPVSKSRIKLCEQIITQIGFSWLDENLLKNIVPDLNYGRSTNNTVSELLFYWDS